MIKTLKKIAKTVFRKQTAIFLFFVILSANFWLMHSIGTNKEIPVSYSIEYINIPDNVKITNTLDKEVNVSVSEGRASFINYFFVKQTERIVIDLKDINKNTENGHKTYSIGDIIENTIKNDFGSTAKASNLNPKIIVVEYITLQSKKVPVVLTKEVITKNQYIISDSIRITPQTVTISGSKKDINATDTIEITDLSLDSLNKNVELLYTFKNNKKFTFDPTSVRINITVEKSTEKILTLDIACVNAPDDLIMKAFPQTVNISLVVPLSKFNEIEANSFIAEIDYNKRTADNRCPIEITSKPKNIKILRTSPQEAEFSLEYPKTK